MIPENYNNPIRFDETLRRFHCLDCMHYDPEELMCLRSGDKEYPGSGACEEFEGRRYEHNHLW